MLDEKKFLDAITEVFRAELDDESVRLDMSTGQSEIAAWDSVAHVRIIMATEGKFGMQFDIDEIETMDSVQKFYDALARHLA